MSFVPGFSLFALIGVFASILPATAFAAGPFGGSVTGMAFNLERTSPMVVTTTRGPFWREDNGWEEGEGVAGDISEMSGLSRVGNKLVALYGVGELAYSRDEGKSWFIEKPEVPKGDKRDVFKNLRMLVGTGGDRATLYLGAWSKGLYESSDGGKSWKGMNEGLLDIGVPALFPTALLPPASGRYLLMGTDGVGVLTQVGHKWKPVKGLPEKLRVQAFAENPKNPQHVVLASRNEGLWQSIDGGMEWTLLYRGQFGFANSISIGEDGKVAAHLPGEGLVIFKDKKPFKPKLFKDQTVFSLEHRKGGGWFGGVEHDGVALITSEGALEGFDNEGLNAVVITAIRQGETDGSFWVGDTNGAFHTSDHGESWEERSKGLPGSQVNGFAELDGVLYAGTGGRGVYRWDKEKNVWIDKSEGLGTSNTIYSIVNHNGMLFVGTEGGMLKRTAESDWTRCDTGLKPSPNWTLAAHAEFEDDGCLWAAGGGYVYASSDSGESWGVIFEGEPQALALWDGGYGPILVGLLPDGLMLTEIGQEPAFEKGPAGVMFKSMAMDGDLVWLASDKGVYSYEPGAGFEERWTGNGVTRIQPLSSGGLLLGTDGRGIVETGELW